MLFKKVTIYSILLMSGVLNLVGCSTSETSASPPDITKVEVKSDDINTPIPVLSTPSAAVTATFDVEGCKTVYDIVLCIQDVTQTESETQVKLKILVENNMVSGSGNSFIFPDEEGGLYPVLLDEQGNSYSLKDTADNYWAQFDDAERVYFQTLYFDAIPADLKKITVSLPMVAVDSPSQAEGFQIDVGVKPQPGQVLDLDVTTTVDGQTLHFVKAEFEGDGVNSLRGTFYTDPLNLPEHIYSMTPLFVEREKGVLFGSKWGMDDLPLRIFADLVIPPGKSSGQTQSNYISGVLNLDVDRITYWYRGPFEIAFQLP
jgi:hypothetical protein